jgi:hypothetical protein
MVRRWGFAAGCAFVLGFLAGCFQGEEKTTLYPDGSGKIEFAMSIKKSLFKMVEAAARTGQEPRLQPDALDGFDRPERVARMAEGIAAWRIRPRREEGEWVHFSFTGYFENINRVVIYDDDGPQGGGLAARQKTVSFRYERRPDGGGVLTAERPQGVDKLGEFRMAAGRARSSAEADQIKAVSELMRPMLRDFRYAVSVTVPGMIERAEGLVAGEGRTARFVMEGETLLGMVAAPEGEALERMEKFARGTVSWKGGGDVPEDWKKELAAAKEEWARTRGRPAAAAEAPRPPAAPRGSLGADADRLSDEEVNRAYARAQIKTAQTYLRSGRKVQAREVLESLLAEFPKLPESEEARRLLEGLKKP